MIEKPKPFIEAKNYKLERKLKNQESSFFKLRSLDKDHIMFSSPDDGNLLIADNNLEGIVKKYHFPECPTSFDIFQHQNCQYVISGCRSGNIYAHEVNLEKQQNKLEERKGFKVFKNLDRKQTYINDTLHYPWNPNLFFNCFINGSLAVWDFDKECRIHTYSKVHDKYVYKIRFLNQSTIVSCGNDGKAVLTDIEKYYSPWSFVHALPIWCAQSISETQIATVGLTGRICIWDIRSKRMCQYVNMSTGESSFITTRNRWEPILFTGDEKKIKKWDRRTNSPEIITDCDMETSSEAIMFKQQKMYVCGRGGDICSFLPNQGQIKPLSEPEIKQKTKQISPPRATFQQNISHMVRRLLDPALLNDIPQDQRQNVMAHLNALLRRDALEQFFNLNRQQMQYEQIISDSQNNSQNQNESQNQNQNVPELQNEMQQEQLIFQQNLYLQQNYQNSQPHTNNFFIENPQQQNSESSSNEYKELTQEQGQGQEGLDWGEGSMDEEMEDEGQYRQGGKDQGQGQGQENQGEVFEEFGEKQEGEIINENIYEQNDIQREKYDLSNQFITQKQGRTGLINKSQRIAEKRAQKMQDKNNKLSQQSRQKQESENEDNEAQQQQNQNLKKKSVQEQK